MSRVSDRSDRCAENNPCAHQCVDTGSAVTCRCFDGFMLDVDGRSCNGQSVKCSQSCASAIPFDQIAEQAERLRSQCSSSEVEATELSAQEHYATHVCMTCFPSLADVDECVVGTHSCQRNQVCVNVVGSFKCETRRGPGHSESRCITGYGYNQLTRECQGKSCAPAVLTMSHTGIQSSLWFLQLV